MVNQAAGIMINTCSKIRLNDIREYMYLYFLSLSCFVHALIVCKCSSLHLQVQIYPLRSSPLL